MSKPLSIMIAEDDFAIGLALKTVLQANFPCQLHTANNGLEAWQKLQQVPVDLVLSDWNMPEKTGRELLTDIRNDPKLKDLPFLMLTARADKESVIQAVKLGVTGYIHKPFNRADLIEKVRSMVTQLEQNATASGTASNVDERAERGRDGHGDENRSEKRDIVKQIVIRLKREQFELPVLSNIADTVQNMIQEHDANVNDISEVVGKDPVITAKILALANSPMYRGSKSYKTLADAISRIGIPETQKFLWIFSNHGVYKSSNPVFSDILSACHLHTIVCAECCRLLAEQKHLSNASEFYFYGLIHDIGILLVTRILEDIAAVEPINDTATVRNAVKQLHTEFGCVLLSRWGMDEHIQNLVRHHEDPAQAMKQGMDLQILYVANRIADSLGYGLTPESAESTEISQLEPAKALQLDDNMLRDLGCKLKDYAQQLKSVLDK